MSQLKQSVYFPKEMLAELRAEARRLKKPLSWVAQRAWKLAVAQIRQIQAPPDLDEKMEVPLRAGESGKERDA